jgi:hypothetical protein
MKWTCGEWITHPEGRGLVIEPMPVQPKAAFGVPSRALFRETS